MKLSYWLACLLGVSINVVWAQGRAELHYFVEAGASGFLPVGEFDGKSKISVDTAGDSLVTPETVTIPKLTSFGQASTRLGVYIDGSSLSLGFGYGNPITSKQGEWIALDFEYQYHFLRPNDWRPSIGANYAFTRLDVNDVSSVVSNGSTSKGHALFSGAGPGLDAGIGWYGLPHFSVQANLRSRFLFFSHITTDANDYSQLDESLFVWLNELALSAQFIF